MTRKTLWHDDAVTMESGHTLTAYQWGVREGLSGGDRSACPYDVWWKKGTSKREAKAYDEWMKGLRDGHDYRAAEEEYGVDHEPPTSKFRLWPLNRFAPCPLENIQPQRPL